MTKTSTTEFLGTGRRKTSIARVRLFPGSGQVTVNNRKLDEYITVPNLRTHAIEPLTATEAAGKFDVTATVEGGGVAGQAGAIRLGISRALLRALSDLTPAIRAKGLL